MSHLFWFILPFNRFLFFFYFLFSLIFFKGIGLPELSRMEGRVGGAESLYMYLIW